MLYTINTHNSYLLLSAVCTLPGLPERKIQWAPSHAVPLHSVAWHGRSGVLLASADLCEKGCPGQAPRGGARRRPLQVSPEDVLLSAQDRLWWHEGTEGATFPNQKRFPAVGEVKLFSCPPKHWPVRPSMLDSQLEGWRCHSSRCCSIWTGFQLINCMLGTALFSS